MRRYSFSSLFLGTTLIVFGGLYFCVGPLIFWNPPWLATLLGEGLTWLGRLSAVSVVAGVFTAAAMTGLRD
jgi:uncharacterized membrane protein (DUF485 family)